MVTWIGQFLTQAQKDTGKRPIVYTNRDFWVQCTGNATSFTLNGTTTPFRDYPLWIANYGVTSPGYPAAWRQPDVLAVLCRRRLPRPPAGVPVHPPTLTTSLRSSKIPRWARQ